MMTQTLLYDGHIDQEFIYRIFPHVVGERPRVKRIKSGYEYLPGVTFSIDVDPTENSGHVGFANIDCSPSLNSLRRDLEGSDGPVRFCEIETGGLVGRTTRVKMRNLQNGCKVEIVGSPARVAQLHAVCDEVSALRAVVVPAAHYEGPIDARVQLHYGGIDHPSNMLPRLAGVSDLAQQFFGRESYMTKEIEGLSVSLARGKGTPTVGRYAALNSKDAEVKIEMGCWVGWPYALQKDADHDMDVIMHFDNPQRYPLPQKYAWNPETWDCGASADITVRGSVRAVKRTVDEIFARIDLPYRVETPEFITTFGIGRHNEFLMDSSNHAGWNIAKRAIAARGAHLRWRSSGSACEGRVWREGALLPSWTP